MTLKNKAALTYLLPLLLAYVGVVSAISAGARPSWADLIGSALPASCLLVVSHLLQDILPKPIKEFLVFYRAHARLPGHRAFTQLCHNDPRVPPDFLEKKVAAIGEDPNCQNAEWYSMYRLCSGEAPVEHENLRYLAWRDATSTLVILAITTPLLMPVGILTWHQVVYVSLGCLALSILTATAARNAAHSLVRNVVAIAASGSAASPME